MQQPVTLRIVSTRLLFGLACSSALTSAGCNVRDEEARGEAVSPWPPQVVERLATPTQRSIESPATSRTIDFVEGYAAGSRRAADARVPMLLVFRASWCRWSQAFTAEIPADPNLVGFAGRFVCVTVDADRDLATCQSFGVQAFPTVIVLDRDRRETFRATGAAARAGLVVAVRSVLEDSVPRIAAQPDAPRR